VEEVVILHVSLVLLLLELCAKGESTALREGCEKWRGLRERFLRGGLREGVLETRTELPDAGQLDGEATQEGDAPLVTTLLGAKGGDMVDLDEGDVPNSASRLQ
jgi:hypothetical protein